MRQDITDTAICIARELYEMKPEDAVRVALIGDEGGYCSEREKIAELARVFDTAWDKLAPEATNRLPSWDMEVVPYLMKLNAQWTHSVGVTVIALTNWKEDI